MFQVERIESLEGPDLLPYKTLRRQPDHRAQNIFVAEGPKLVSRLLASQYPVQSILMPEKWLEPFRAQLEARPENIKVFLCEKKATEELVGFTMYQGVLAVGEIPHHFSLEEVLNPRHRPFLFAAVDGVSSAENLGALVRNCLAFSSTALLVDVNSASPYLRRAVRNSMGAIFHLPTVENVDLAKVLPQLRERGIRILAAHPHTNQRSLPDANFREDCCVIFGSEGLGIRAEILALCDEQVVLPMPPNVDSLNVASASAVFLYEAWRQRVTASQSAS